MQTKTSPRQQAAETSLKKHRNPKRRRRSDDEYTEPTNHTLILYLRNPPKDKRNLPAPLPRNYAAQAQTPANTQNQTPRPHLTATIRPVMPGTRRRSRQMRHRKMCMPQRDSGPSGTTPTVSRAGKDRRTRNRGRNRHQHHRDKQSMITWKQSYHNP